MRGIRLEESGERVQVEHGKEEWMWMVKVLVPTLITLWNERRVEGQYER